jgi:hypothetical protein
VLRPLFRAGGDDGLSQAINLAYLVALAVADSGFVYLTASESYASGGLIDTGWFFGYLLVLLAARKPDSDPVDEEEETGAGVDRMGMFLPYIAVVGSLGVSTVAQVQQGILDSFAAWTRSFIIVALVGREVLSLLENASLARHLEARVVERTAELRASESMTRVFGYSEAHLLGRPLSQILDPDAGPGCARA